MNVSVFVNVNHTVISVPVSSPQSTTALRCASVIIDAWAWYMGRYENSCV